MSMTWPWTSNSPADRGAESGGAPAGAGAPALGGGGGCPHGPGGDAADPPPGIKDAPSQPRGGGPAPGAGDAADLALGISDATIDPVGAGLELAAAVSDGGADVNGDAAGEFLGCPPRMAIAPSRPTINTTPTTTAMTAGGGIGARTLRAI